MSADSKRESRAVARKTAVRGTAPSKATVRSFAKINLGLHIGPVRPDGFHELLTVYQTIGLHDVLHFSAHRGSGIEIRSSDPRVPCDSSNTCYRIVERALDALKLKKRIVIEINKRLPVQGGLGGGSGNAAATLVGLERAIGRSLPLAEKLCIAAEVGSDVPLFLVGGTVLGVGRGEQVYPVPDLPSMPCVIVLPDIKVSTPKAFKDWDRIANSRARPEVSMGARTRVSAPHESARKLTSSAPSDRMNELGRALSAWLGAQDKLQPYSGAPRSFRRGRAENPLLELVRAGIENDFELVVFPEYPELRDGKRALMRAGAKYASLSGSGSSLFGLFDSAIEAANAVKRLREQGLNAVATRTLTRREYWSKLSVSQ